MDFHALPRRDLQVLCKRNGVRANMTNAAMADALGALPAVYGVEEYIKQPAAVPEPAGKAAVAEEEARREKQGSPLPRGRRVTAKTSEVVKPEESKGKEEEKADAKRESNREEDAPALGVGRRGASRRTRPTPVVAAPAAEPAFKEAADKQGSPPPRARPEPARPDDDGEKGNLKREANKEAAPVQGVVRRGPSRRARPASVVAASAAEPETKAAAQEEEMQRSPLPRARRVTSKPPEPARPDDIVEKEEEDMKRESNNDDAPAQVVGRRGPIRGARPAAVVSKPVAKAAVEEELGSPLPRGRRVDVNVKSSAPIGTEGGEVDKNEDMQREASKWNVQALGVGRRGASRRARPEPAVSAPVDEVPAEEDAPVPPRRRGKVKAPEPTRPNDGEEEDKEEVKLEEKEEDAPALGVARRGPSRRAQPALVEAPATRRRDATSTTEERDVPVEAVLVRPARTRKTTMKAAAAAEEKVPRRTTKKAAPRNSTLQKEKQQEVPQEAVPALASDEACNDLENVEEAPQNVEQSEVIDEPKQEDEDVLMNEDELVMEAILVRSTRVRKLTMKAVAAVEEKVPQRTTKKDAPRTSTLQKEKQQEEPQEAVPAPVSDEACYDLENVEETADPQNLEQNEVIDEPRQEDEEVLMNEDILMDETPAEKPPVTDEILMEESLAEEPPVIDEEWTGKLAVEKKECKDKSLVEEQQVDVEPCGSLLHSMEDSPVLGLVSMFAEQTIEKDEDEAVQFHEGAGPSKGQLYKEMSEETNHAGEEMEMVPFIQALQAPHTTDEPAAEVGFTGHTDHGSEMESSNSVQGTEDSTTVDAEDGLVYQEKGDFADDEAEEQPNTVEEMEMVPFIQALQAPQTADEPAAEVGFTGHADHGIEMESSNSVQGTEDTTTVDAEDGLVCQEKGDFADDESEEQPNTVDEAVIVDCSGNIISVVKEEKVVETMVAEPVQNEGVVSDNVTQVTLIDGMEKAEKVTEELPQGSAKLDENCEEDDLQTNFVGVDEQKLVVDVEKADLVTDKLLHSRANVNEDVERDYFQSDEHKLVVDVEAQLVTDKLTQSTATMDEDVEEDFQTDFVHVEEQKEITTADSMQEVIMNGNIVVDKVLITKESQQSTATMDEDVDGDHLETDFVLAEKQNEVTTADKGPKLTVTDGEVDEEEKDVEITQEAPQITGTMDACVQEGYFNFVDADELEKVVTADNVLETTETEGEDVGKESAFTGDLPREDITGDYTDHITSALLDDITESLSMITITDPTVSRNEDVPLCKNSCEKNTDEPVSENRSDKNTAEPVTTQENNGVKVGLAKKSADLNGLSLGKLKAKLKKTLKRKDEKRVDENICRSNTIEQEQVRKLQQY